MGKNSFGDTMLDKKEYHKLIKRKSKKSKLFVNSLFAFLIGGGICTVGQGFIDIYKLLGASEDNAKTFCSITLIFIGIMLTAFHLYEKIARYGGAGTLVPITGFANSVASSAIEFKREGFILGVGTKMFAIAGPVLVYGTSASVIYGLIYYVTTII